MYRLVEEEAGNHFWLKFVLMECGERGISFGGTQCANPSCRDNSDQESNLHEKKRKGAGGQRFKGKFINAVRTRLKSY